MAALVQVRELTAAEVAEYKAALAQAVAADKAATEKALAQSQFALATARSCW